MRAAHPYRSSSTRRSPAEIETICAEIVTIALAEQPMTVRQVFYQLVSRDLVDKTEGEYNHTVVRLLTKLRREGRLPWQWIADNTRWMRKAPSYDSMDEALQQTAQTYRRALWSTQPVYVEVWLEKDALAGVLLDVTNPFDVPLMVTRGYSSETFLYSAAETLAAQDKPCCLYYLGDHDPSGRDIPRVVERRLRELAPHAEIHFYRIAVTEEQIEAWALPTRPTKATDSRAGRFTGESVEVDAIPPAQLRQLVSNAIEQYLDQRALDVLRVAETSERDLLLKLSTARTRQPRRTRRRND